MACRIKEKRHWAGICTSMTMALVYIASIEFQIPPPRVYPRANLSCGAPNALVGPPLGGQVGLGGGGEGKVKATKTKTSKEKKKEIGR